MKKILIICWLLSAMYFSWGQNIVQAEYFLDTDLGYGKNTVVNVNPLPDGTFPLLVSFPGAPAGYHKLYIRTKDSNGKWSHTSRKNIEIAPAANNRVTGGEYFFDIDPGFAAANPITVSPQDTVILQNFTAVAAALPLGYHKLYIRLKDANGSWSQTARRNMEMANLPISVVKGGEYFFTTDAGIGNAFPVTFTTPLADGSFSFNIPIDNIPTGAKTLNLRVKDSVNQSWSLTHSQPDSVVTSVQSGLWSDTATWSNRKIPVSSTVVILRHNVTVDIMAFCKSLTPYRNDVHVLVNQGIILNITGH